MDLNYFKEVAIEENKKNQEEEKDICPICLLPLKNFVIKTGCHHKFHMDCYIEFERKKGTKCPNCRRNISNADSLLSTDRPVKGSESLSGSKKGSLTPKNRNLTSTPAIIRRNRTGS